MKLPEEIINFWKQQGYNEIYTSSSGYIFARKLDPLDPERILCRIRIAYIYPHELKYFMDNNINKEYSEEEMLKLIKLKAFW